MWHAILQAAQCRHVCQCYTDIAVDVNMSTRIGTHMQALIPRSPPHTYWYLSSLMRWLGRPEVVDVPGQRLQPAGTPLEHQHAVQAILAVLQGTLKLDMPLAGLVVRQRQRSLHAHDQQPIRVRPDAVRACMPISPASMPSCFIQSCAFSIDVCYQNRFIRQRDFWPESIDCRCR